MRILFIIISILGQSCTKKAIQHPKEIMTQMTSILGKPVYLRIFKQEHILELWYQDRSTYKLYKTFDICTWAGSLGPKLKEGDGQSPEGFYSISTKQLKPDSKYHRAFNLGFPNTYDKAHKRTGSYLMVHGGCVSIGCYAMTDPVIDQIYTLVEAALNNGQKTFSTHIFPFKMTNRNMDKYKHHQWINFWRNLKEGYDFFEKSKVPPKVKIVTRQYIFQ